MPNWLPPDWQSTAWSAVATIVLAWLGRMLYHVRLVQKRERRFWSLHLVWELLTAICIGFVADGLAAYLGFTGKPAVALVIVVSYLGPGGIEALIIKYLGRLGGKGGC